MNTTLHETLLKTGMEPTTAEIYLTLVENGEMTVPGLLEKVPLSRATVYEALPTLLAEGFVEYRKEGRVAYYKPNHPTKLFTLMEEKKREVVLLEGEFKNMVQSLAGMFNLSNNQPGVRLFEGIDGIQEMLEDTFTHNEQKKLYTFTDLSAYAKYLGDWNKTYYAPKRKELGIELKGLVLDNTEALEFLRGYTASELTEVLFIDHKIFPFGTEINIYEDHVSFISFAKDLPMGVLIENKEIAQTLKSIFEFAWGLAKEYYQHPQPTWKEETDVLPTTKEPEENLGSGE